MEFPQCLKYLLSAVVLMGCGGGVDRRMEGSWFGVGVSSISGEAAVTQSANILITLTDKGAIFSPVCYDNVGALTVLGSGDNLSWSGSYSCPPTQFTNCSSVVLTFKSATAKLENTTLFLHAEGILTGCGHGSSTTLDFNLHQ